MSSRIEPPEREGSDAKSDAPASGARPAAEGPEGVPTVGEVLAGKYKVERVLGVGGMGAVVAALHMQLGERVALKFLLPSMANAETTQRFAREARAAARIKSEHIARVTDVGTLESGAPYMVMEFLEGSDLSEVLKDQGMLPIRDAVEYVIQACDAVAEAHAIGIVHRDLKPANLFLSRRPGAPPRVKVLDFGISKIIEEDGGPLEQRAVTRTRAWLGSPLYMAPEQMKSARDVDARTDVWAMGVILFELLTRSVPFTGSNLPELCAEILHGKPANVEDRRPEVGREIGDVIRKCLERDPLRRYQNIGELVLALVDFAPRRARSVAERAISVLEEAGVMRPGAPRHALDATMADSVRSPSAVPPASSQYGGATPAIPGPPRTPSFASLPSGGGIDAATAATMLERPAGLEVVPHEAAEPRRSAWFAPLAVLFTLLASLGGVFAFLKYRDASATPPVAETAAPSAAAPTSAPASSPAPSPTPAPSAVATAATATPSATAAASAAPTAAPSASPSTRPGGAARPSPSASAHAGPRGKLPTAAPEAPAAQPASPSPAPKGGDLRMETCKQPMPDGTFKVVPCP